MNSGCRRRSFHAATDQPIIWGCVMNDEEKRKEKIRAAMAAARKNKTWKAEQYFEGYERGLRRRVHGENFGTPSEHKSWIAASRSTDPDMRQRGEGYVDGLLYAPTDADTVREILKTYNLSGSVAAEHTFLSNSRSIRRCAAKRDPNEMPIARLVLLAARQILTDDQWWTVKRLVADWTVGIVPTKEKLASASNSLVDDEFF